MEKIQLPGDPDQEVNIGSISRCSHMGPTQETSPANRRIAKWGDAMSHPCNPIPSLKPPTKQETLSFLLEGVLLYRFPYPALYLPTTLPLSARSQQLRMQGESPARLRLP
jgi:hypothetical protein